MTETIIEAPLVLTLKCSDDRDSPWLVARASNIQQLQSMLHEIENGTIAVDIGRVAATFQAQARIGARLEAKPLNPAVDGGSFDGVTAAATMPPASTPPAAATPPAAPAKKAAAFPAFKTPPPTAKPPAAPPPVTTARPPAEAPPAAPAVDGFPAAPQWKRP